MCLAVPGIIISLENEQDIMRCGRVDFGGVVKNINLAFVPEAGIDDYVLVHAGFAIGVVKEDDEIRMLSEIHAISGDRHD